MVTVGDVRLHCTVAGAGDAVVLLHGWPQHSHHWRTIIPALAERYTVIAPDQRGAGGSSIPAGGYDKRTMADDVRQLVRHLGHDRVHLVGFDLGGGTAYAYASRYPDEVRSLAVLEYAPAGFGYEAGLTAAPENENWQLAFFTNPDVAVQFIQGRERELLAWYFWHWSYDPDAVGMADFELYVRQLQKPGALRAGFSYFASVWTDMAHNREHAARKLPMPVLALGGERGAGEYPLMAMRQLAADVRGGVIPRAGHWLTDEQPAALAEALLAFFDAVAPEPRAAGAR
jgi:pimeloyl-ACP methyl ester carboxylesterase